MRVDRRTCLRLFAGAGLLASAPALWSPARASSHRSSCQTDVLRAMKRASDFMREHCAVQGGYVWQYAADFSRRWGEMEAYPSMIWLQPPGTSTVGHVYLDCYHATGDEYFYDAAAEVGGALVAAQHPAGGWNYLHDFDGKASLQRWYDTIGSNGWRLEEFHHFYGNATFDDAGTIEAAMLLLRLFLEKREARWGEPLEAAIAFVLDAQYDNGGWPQRFPFVDDMPALHGMPDYTRHITFNDDVVGANIRFLLMVWQSLGDERALDALRKAMNVVVDTQQPAPQAGWGSQHDVATLRPVAARSYEPAALVTHVTANNIGLLLDFYEWTREDRFLARIPDALGWLESVRLDADEIRMPGREFPTYIEIGSNRPLFTHRRGSNVVNGAYYLDYDPGSPVTHNAQWRVIDIEGLRRRFDDVRGNSLEPSPLTRQAGFTLPTRFINVPPSRPPVDPVESLGAAGSWQTPLRMTSHPYRGAGPATVTPGDFSGTFVGDEFDTSPYFATTPEPGISTRVFVGHMAALAASMAAAAEAA